MSASSLCVVNDAAGTVTGPKHDMRLWKTGKRVSPYTHFHNQPISTGSIGDNNNEIPARRQIPTEFDLKEQMEKFSQLSTGDSCLGIFANRMTRTLEAY